MVFNTRKQISMKKHKYRHRKSKGMSKKEMVGWAIATFVFTVSFVSYFIYSFTSNCIFEWPIRWDVKSCWNEQVGPSREKASEATANFIP